METMREAWTDERLDDLVKRMDEGFREMREEQRAFRAEMNARFESMEGRFQGIEGRMIQIGAGLFGTMLVGFLSLVVLAIFKG
jgi:hypothetical protein